MNLEQGTFQGKLRFPTNFGPRHCIETPSTEEQLAQHGDQKAEAAGGETTHFPLPCSCPTQ